MKFTCPFSISLLFFALVGLRSGSIDAVAPSPDLSISINISQRFRTVSPLLYAAFIEDVNHAVEGGLHGELLSDVQCRGPFLSPSLSSSSSSKASLLTLSTNTTYIRYCGGGSYVLTQDGTGDATFFPITPGLSGTPGSYSFITMSAPNTGSVLGNFLVVNSDGTLDQKAADGTESFNRSASFVATPVVGEEGMMTFTFASEATWANGWLLQASGQYPGTSGPCTWIGGRGIVTAAPPPPGVPVVGTYSLSFSSSSTQQSLDFSFLWSITPPLQPDQAAWVLMNGTDSALAVNGTFDETMPPLNPNSTTALRIDILNSSRTDTRFNFTSSSSSSAAAASLPGVCNTGFYGIGINASGGAFNASAWIRIFSGTRGGSENTHTKINDSSGESLITAFIFSLESSTTNAGVPVTTYATSTLQVAPNSFNTWVQYVSSPLVVAPFTPPLHTNDHNNDSTDYSSPHPSNNNLISAALGDGSARFCIRAIGSGTFWIDSPSLYPSITFQNRSNGMRLDLANLVNAINPAAFRFPGGCFVEGLNASTAVNYTRGIGPVEQRPGHYNLWQYWSSDRMGLYEYLQFCEDLQTEPVLVLNIGLFYGGGSDPIEPWIEHALATLEFVLAPTSSSSYWASIRASMGHPEPFSLRFVALGNENSGSDYINNHYIPLAAALRQVYPPEVLTFIGNFNFTGVEVFDYHTYPPVDTFFETQYTFDPVTRYSGMAKVFNSEYAAKDGAGKGNLIAALSEAAWMIGLERNSDLVIMAAYAPLFVQTNDADWLPDAIQFDSLRSFGTPSYYTQVLFANNNKNMSTLVGYNVTASSSDRAAVGTGVPAVTAFGEGLPLTSNAGNFSISVTLEEVLSSMVVEEEKDGAGAVSIVIKMVNYASVARTCSITLTDLPPGCTQPSLSTLTSLASQTSNPLDENTFQEPTRVSLSTSSVPTGSGEDSFTILPFTAHVLRMPLVVSATSQS